MKRLANWLKNEESGQGMVEYALILALIAIVAIVGFKALGTKANTLAQNVADNIKTTS